MIDHYSKAHHHFHLGFYPGTLFLRPDGFALTQSEIFS